VDPDCSRVTLPERTDDPELSVLGWTDPVGVCAKCEARHEDGRRKVAANAVPAPIRNTIHDYWKAFGNRVLLDKALHAWVKGGCRGSICAWGPNGKGKRTAMGAAAYSVLRRGTVRDAWWIGADEVLEAAQSVWEKGNPMPRQILRKCEKVGLLVIPNMFAMGGAEYKLVGGAISPSGKEVGQLILYRLDRDKPTLVTSPVKPHWEMFGDDMSKQWARKGKIVEVG
jgi:hypothetical protein